MPGRISCRLRIPIYLSGTQNGQLAWCAAPHVAIFGHGSPIQGNSRRDTKGDLMRAIQCVLDAAIITTLCVRAAAYAFPSFEYHTITANGGKSGGTSLVDVDKDGDLDFLMPYFGGGNYVWYECNGLDSWEPHTIGGPTETDVGGCAFDVDRDGWVDAVTDKHWFRNTGGGWDKHQYSNEDRNHDVISGDIDNDGITDIVTGGPRGLNWYRNPGNPTSNHNWSRTQISGESHHGGTAPHGVGDLDGDGDADVVWGDRWCENANGSGTQWHSHSLPH
ncbi:MAG: hypothetical protein GF410_14185, partial [Chitinivibrionales bacterium]|nr:hypothetical protein [Chitinivibrionales bacterium]